MVALSVLLWLFTLIDSPVLKRCYYLFIPELRILHATQLSTIIYDDTVVDNTAY